MSTETKPTPAKNDHIPVKLIRFVQAVDIPGKRGASSATDERKGAGHHELAYVPSIRHMRITYTSGVEGEAAITQFVPIERVMVWEAA